MRRSVEVLRPAYRDPNVMRWVAAYTASVAGDSVYFLSLSWAAVTVGGPSVAGVVTAVGAVPRALLLLAGGVVADRFGPRRTIIASDGARCVLIFAATGLLWLTTPGLWLLLPLAAIFGVVDALFMPAVGALPPRIAAPEQLSRVQSMRSFAVRASNLAGPIIAGAALAGGRERAGFCVAGGLFLVSLLLLIAVRVRPLPSTVDSVETTARRDLKDGMSYIRRHRTLRPLLIAIGLSEMCFSGPVSLVLILFADERGWGAAAVGWMLGAFSVGGAAAAIALTVRPHVRHAGPVSGAFLALTALATGALPAAGALPLALGMVAVMGASSGVAGVLANSLVQIHSAPEYLGRVTAVLSLGIVGLAPILYPLTGSAAAAWGTRSVFLACAAITLSAALIMAAARSLRASTT